jgi:hypothetical protein
MPGDRDRDRRSTAAQGTAQGTLDVLRAAGSAIGALGGRRDEGGASASPKILEPTRVLGAPAAN